MFNRDVKTIGKHINNALKEELAGLATVANFATVQKEGERTVTRHVEYYNLDMILSVGYRVKSNRGIEFRRWANSVLKEYLLISHQLQLDLQKHNSQYPPIGIHIYRTCHDRFLIIDGTEVWHIGVSLKDLGKKMFAFSRLNIPAEAVMSML